MLPAPWLLALGLVLALLVMIPARRLQLAGVEPRTIGLFALGLWLLAMLVAIRPGATRILIPILLVAFLAPFVAAPEPVGRFLRRGRRRRGPQDGPPPPMKNVTPPEAAEPPDSRGHDGAP